MLRVHGRLEVPCRHVHRGVHARLEVRTWRGRSETVGEHDRGVVWRMVRVMCQTAHHGCSGQQGTADFRPKTGTAFHVHLAEYLGKELHAVVVVHGKELVVVFLGNLMAYPLAVDDGGHAVLAFCFGGLHADFAHADLPAVPPFTEPSLVLIDIGQVIPIYGRTFAGRFRFHGIPVGGLCRLYPRFSLRFLCLCRFYFLPHFRAQVNGDAFLAVQRFHRDGGGEVGLDDAVQRFQPLLQ